VNQLAASWAVSAATLTLLSLSAWHNRRSGFQRKRVEESGFEEALGWLMALRASLSPDDDAAVRAPAEPASSTGLPDATLLLSLNAALQRSVRNEADRAPEPIVPSGPPAEIRTLK